MDDDRFELLRKLARTFPGGMAAGRWLRRKLDPDTREIYRLLETRANELFQPSTFTEINRYPQLFDALADRLRPIPEPHILCFGCSSGEEVRALGDRLPHARITGIDINRRAIAKAIRRNTSLRADYRVAAQPPPGGRYDAILALAVFRHVSLEEYRPDSCDTVLPFERFAGGVSLLDQCLKEGGWLAIFNAHFRFGDVPLAEGYAIDPFRMNDRAPQFYYGADNRRHDEPYLPALFHKLGPTAPD